MWRGGRGMSIQIKTPEQIAVMREAGLVVARTLRVLAGAVRPGITTAELDAIAEAEIRGAGRGPRLRPGMALAIEPMVMLGGPETVLLADEWTVVTADGSRAAHFEHTVAITPDGPWVLTAEDGGESGFAGHRDITETSLGDTRKKDPESVPPT